MDITVAHMDQGQAVGHMVQVPMVGPMDQAPIADPQSAEEPNVQMGQDQMDIQVAHMDQVPIVGPMDQAPIAAPMDLDPIPGFWLEYWVEDPKQKKKIL